MPLGSGNFCVLSDYSLQALVRARRPKGGPGAYRERAHLLLLYEDLVGCAQSPEPRVRAALQDLLLAAGEELGLARTAWTPRSFSTTSEATELL